MVEAQRNSKGWPTWNPRGGTRELRRRPSAARPTQGFGRRTIRSLRCAPSLLLALLLAVGGCGSGDARASSPTHTLFQTSTLGALNVGIYQGELTIGELRRHGDLGLGTFDALDGEMVVLDGDVFRVPTDGVPQRVPDEATTPFAAVTDFAPDQVLNLAGPLDYAALQQALDAQLSSFNIPIAFKIVGEFPWLQTRSVARQSMPYPPLSDAVAGQTVFDLTDSVGTMVGFRTPSYLAQVNAAGYHFHFLSDDRRSGGHVLDAIVGPVRVEMQYMRDFRMLLPENDAFAGAPLAAGGAARMVQP
jgi:acetolactate decarboxylase